MTRDEKVQQVNWLTERLFELGGARSMCGRFYQVHSLDEQIEMLGQLVEGELGGAPADQDQS